MFARTYWAETYWPPSYWPSEGAEKPDGYWPPRYWAMGYWMPNYWPGEPQMVIPPEPVEGRRNGPRFMTVNVGTLRVIS